MGGRPRRTTGLASWLLLPAAVALAGCAVLREAAAAPLELFGGHGTAVALGLRDPESRSYADILDGAKASIPRSDTFRVLCTGAAEVWYQVHLLQAPAPLRMAALLPQGASAAPPPSSSRSAPAPLQPGP